MRTDFDTLEDGDRVVLHPRPNNPIHKKPVTVTFDGRHFWGDGSDAAEGPDYYLGDVLNFCEGFELPVCSNFLSDGRGCCRTCGHFHGPDGAA